MSEDRPIEVAIVGGGCAGLAAAFELSRPEHQGRFRVTVYQLGWRLGGKGASGRGPAGRIEEHGLHLWMGFYENAFRLMRECYVELGRDPSRCPIADWRDAFVPTPFAGVTDELPGGQWEAWTGLLPSMPGLPGDPFPDGAPRWTIGDYMTRSLALVRTLLEAIRAGESGGGEERRLGVGLASFLAYGELASMTAILQAIASIETAIGSLSQYRENVVLQVLDAIAANTRALLEDRLGRDLSVRRVWQIVDLTLATIRGMIRFNLLTEPRGFDAIDEYDAREWLRLNGASEGSLRSGYLRALYDFGFSYENGDVTKPRISAGQALRSMLRSFFTYRGSYFWRMEAGMGDVVFAPLYEVLARRGVRFEFFHRLENVRLADPGEGSFVSALELDVQAEVRGGGQYRPLVDVGELPCWPAEPDYDQLVDGERLRQEGWQPESHWDRRKVRSKTLRVGEDFDFVVLAIGLGAVPHVCRNIVARDPRWRAMIDHVQTVATQALQVWLRADMEELGWTSPPITLSGFVEPFDTWADMRHLLPREEWVEAPRSLAYFCSVLPDVEIEGRGDVLALQTERVRQNALRFLDRDVRHLWPNVTNGNGGFRWELLADHRDREGNGGAAAGPSRFDSQFWKANVSPTDRYALSLPGSSAYRISPLDDTWDNLTVAGDWTDCGFNAGCVEAAVMSGRLAAHALSQLPRLEDIVGYDHP